MLIGSPIGENNLSSSNIKVISLRTQQSAVEQSLLTPTSFPYCLLCGHCVKLLRIISGCLCFEQDAMSSRSRCQIASSAHSVRRFVLAFHGDYSVALGAVVSEDNADTSGLYKNS
jgi:hypothetical protein